MASAKKATVPTRKPVPAAPEVPTVEPTPAAASAALGGPPVYLCPCWPDLPPAELFHVSRIVGAGKPALRLPPIRPDLVTTEDDLLERYGSGRYRLTPMAAGKLVHPPVEVQVGLPSEAIWETAIPPQVAGLTLSLMRDFYNANMQAMREHAERTDKLVAKQIEFVGSTISTIARGPDDRVHALLERLEAERAKLADQVMSLREKVAKKDPEDQVPWTELAPFLPDLLAAWRGQPRAAAGATSPAAPAGASTRAAEPAAAPASSPASPARRTPDRLPTAQEIRAVRERGAVINPEMLVALYQGHKLGKLPPELVAELGDELLAFGRWLVERGEGA